MAEWLKREKEKEKEKENADGKTGKVLVRWLRAHAKQKTEGRESNKHTQSGSDQRKLYEHWTDFH